MVESAFARVFFCACISQVVEEVFTDGITYERTMLQMQREKWLAPTICYQVNSRTDLSTVPTVAREYSLRQLNKVVNNEERNELVVQTYHELFPGRQALVFCCSLDHVHSLEKQFIASGVKAAAIVGTTAKDTREEVLQGFRAGTIQVCWLNFASLPCHPMLYLALPCHS